MAEDESKRKEIPPGASSLFDLFTPPSSSEKEHDGTTQVKSTGSSSGHGNNTITTGSNNSSSNGSIPPGATSLMDLFAPPPNERTESSIPGHVGTEDKMKGQTNASTINSNSSGSNGSSTSPATARVKEPHSQQKSNAQSLASAAANRALMDLFQPPPKDGEEKSPPQQDRGEQQQEKVRADSSSSSVMTAPPSPPKTSPPKIPSRTNLKVRIDSGGSSSVASAGGPPPSPPERPPRPLSYPDRLKRQSTAPRSNRTSATARSSTEQTSLLQQQQQQQWWLKDSPASLPTPKAMGGQQKKVYNATSEKLLRASDSLEPPLLLSAIYETKPHETNHLLSDNYNNSSTTVNDVVETEESFVKKHLGPTTFVGSFMFLLYHVVFCLAMGSSITRSGSDKSSILGIMANVTCVGIIFASPCFIYRMGNQVPSLYATCDLFLAPFLANLATVVDTTLENDTIKDDQVFFATFLTLSGIGMCLSGTLLVLASKFKLANLGTYLPYPVLCGFFSAVGIMLWALSFAVDTNGHQWQAVLFSGDVKLVMSSLQHHVPSLLVGVTMKWLGPKNPFYVSLLVMTTIMIFYIVMWASGTTLHEAQELEWFWSRDDLIYKSRVKHIGFDNWATPAPFGVMHSLFTGKVHWGAVMAGMPTVCALSFLYLLRCSLHATALKKNISNLVRIVPIETQRPPTSPPQLLRGISNGFKNTVKSPAVVMRRGSLTKSPASSFRIKKKRGHHHRVVSEAVDIESIADENDTQADKDKKFVEIRAKNTKLSLQDILMEYAFSQYLVAVVGGFVVCPSIAIAPTMYAIGAEGVAPQYGSVILLLIFYLTDFQLVCYIPKAAFSCLLVLAACDMIITWFVKSFHKTKDLTEWLVVPLIVVFAFVVGLLNAVFLGVAISTFIFVASFFRTGVVKYAATGLTIRSTIERSITTGNWLDQNGDLIQILVIQNYLFFGNASSILHYISTMFEEPDISERQQLNFQLPPIPKIIILDMTLITGMDTSTVDVFSDIKTMAAGHDCKLFLSGLTPRMRSILALGGIKPERGVRSKRHLRMFPDLDSALGKAEDFLIRDMEQEREQRPRLLSEGDNGFRYALRQIDEQHGKEFALGLVGLHKYTAPVELEPGEPLFSSEGTPLHERQRGLFFIEYGMMKIERDPTETLTRGNVGSLKRRMSRNDLTRMNARTGTIGRQAAAVKAGAHEMTSQNLRLARVGPGWVVGAIEGVTGWKNPGCHIAVSFCRLHHLPYTKIAEIEKENPVLILRLYKMLAHLMARRQEVTIEQLATLHSIMTSPPLTKPMSRTTQGALANIQNSLI